MYQQYLFKLSGLFKNIYLLVHFFNLYIFIYIHFCISTSIYAYLFKHALGNILLLTNKSNRTYLFNITFLNRI